MVTQAPPGNVGPLTFTLLVAVAIVAVILWAPLRIPGALPRPFAPVATAPAAATPTPTERPTLPPAAELHSRWISQTTVPQLVVGTSSRVTLIFRNTGGITWELGRPSEVRLGVVGEDRRFHEIGMADDWLTPTRPARQTEVTVKRGETATFTFGVRGVRPGVFELRLRPVVDGVTWLNDEGVFVRVEVVADIPADRNVKGVDDDERP
jgi:hypothetical protein